MTLETETNSINATIDGNVRLDSKSNKPKCALEGEKRVHWYHKVLKKKHVRIRDMTPEERQAVWYTEQDSKLILAMAKVTVKMIMKDEPCDDIDYCKRGLEGKTPSGSKRRQKNKMKVRRAVLEEQEIQREEGIFNAEYLAEVARVISQPIIEEAYDKGLQDELNVQEYLSNFEIDCCPRQPRR